MKKFYTFILLLLFLTNFISCGYQLRGVDGLNFKSVSIVGGSPGFTKLLKKKFKQAGVKVQEENKDTSHIIYDRCTLDNIAYTLWSHEKGVKGFTKQFCADQIAIMRDSMKHLDIIFLCSFDESQQIEDDGIRETHKAYIKEVDNIFNSLFSQYTNNVESDIFFPKDDTPCVLTVPSDAQKRIDLISEYVDEEGDMYGDEDSVLNSENLKELESLVYQQKTEADHENHMKDLHKKFGI